MAFQLIKCIQEKILFHQAIPLEEHKYQEVLVDAITITKPADHLGGLVLEDLEIMLMIMDQVAVEGIMVVVVLRMLEVQVEDQVL